MNDRSSNVNSRDDQWKWQQKKEKEKNYSTDNLFSPCDAFFLANIWCWSQLPRKNVLSLVTKLYFIYFDHCCAKSIDTVWFETLLLINWHVKYQLIWTVKAQETRIVWLLLSLSDRFYSFTFFSSSSSLLVFNVRLLGFSINGYCNNNHNNNNKRNQRPCMI